jgi:deoxycytidylate deaminase
MSCVVGVTGAFGSGCTLAAKTARDDRKFKYVALSSVIRTKWSDTHTEQPTRTDLQALGDSLREQDGADTLARNAVDGFGVLPERVVVDGIRNTGEIAYLRKRFGYDFTLIAVLASTEDRWSRVRTAYTDSGLKQLDFHQDDLRDRTENSPTGQQVQDCVAIADVFMDNSGSLHDFSGKVLQTIDLISGDSPRPPGPSEVMMHLAFSASHTSQCLKRHVGAVVADERDQLISLGYNENPIGTNPCASEPTYDNRCFRDIVRDAHFKTLAQVGALCPVCGEKLPELSGSRWECPACAKKSKKTNLETFYFPDRAMNWCTAVHAEVAALMAAGRRANGATLYTTTYPCLQCVEKISQAGIRKIVFTEAYTDPYSENRLKLAGIEVVRFEGVRSSSFERLFPRPS